MRSFSGAPNRDLNDKANKDNKKKKARETSLNVSLCTDDTYITSLCWYSIQMLAKFGEKSKQDCCAFFLNKRSSL